MSESAAPLTAKVYSQEIWLMTVQQWAAQPELVLPSFAKGRETDTGREKTGDGVTAWVDLPYDTPDGSPFTGQAIDDSDFIVPEGPERVPLVEDVAPAYATGSIKVAEQPTDGALLTVGAVTFVIVDDAPTSLYEIEIGTDEADTAIKIGDAIDTLSSEVGCSATVEPDATEVLLESNSIGTIGNYLPLSSTDGALITEGFEGGVDAGARLVHTTASEFGGGGGQLTADELAAVQGAEEPSGDNVFITTSAMDAVVGEINDILTFING